MSDNSKRVISGAVLTAVLVLLCAVGGPLLLAACAALSVLALSEFFRAVSMGTSPFLKADIVCTVLFYGLLLFFGEKAILPVLFAVFFVLTGISLLRFPELPVRETALAFFGFFYISVLMSCLYLARNMEQGVWLFILVFICSWLGDTFGYVFGRRFGKHKMTPKLSPKKSFEGLAAEIIGVTAVAALFGCLLRDRLSVYSCPILRCLLCGFFGSGISVCGDLFASAVKREYGIKDYSSLIPGHGGILDRFDSVLMTAPFVTLVFMISGI